MHGFRKLALITALLLVVGTALSLVPALADPPLPHGTAPRPRDIVGVGSQVIQYLFDQFSLSYNAAAKASAPHLYSWDATGTSLIVAKKGCAKAPRPRNSLQGILGGPRNPLGLTFNLKVRGGSAFCTDFARSDIGPSPMFPPGIVFVPFGLNAVSYATNTRTFAPGNLSAAQLTAIYTCSVTNWDQVGGRNGRINPQLPSAGSVTLKFFLTALGLTTPGPCVNASPGENPSNAPQQDEGVSKFLRGPGVIFPYAVPDYIAQGFHSARCLNSSCVPVNGVICKPRRGQNLFGCDVHGTLVPRDINHKSPTVIVNKSTQLNRHFAPAFLRFVIVVVREAPSEPGQIPGYLQRLYGPKGWLFTNRTAAKDICAYGFASIPARPC